MKGFLLEMPGIQMVTVHRTIENSRTSNKIKIKILFRKLIYFAEGVVLQQMFIDALDQEIA